MHHPPTAVIVTTYNSPTALRMCLLGLAAQTEPDFEVVIADDGSDERTRRVLEAPGYRGLRIRHVWQEDKGYRVRMARNRAIAETKAEFLLFLDGDCIPRNDFVARHRQLCPRGYFISGSRIDVSPAVHQTFSDDQILSNHIFDWRFLASQDAQLARYRWRLQRDPWYESLANLLTWRYCVFVSSNGSAWREDILRINGFDESFAGYGNDDRDLGVRLRNAGTAPRYFKFSLIVMHLDHPRPYFDRGLARISRRAMKRRMLDGTTRVALGIDTVRQRV
jgi:glycosyltransferase involved in cell wall biosynthesis